METKNSQYPLSDYEEKQFPFTSLESEEIKALYYSLKMGELMKDAAQSNINKIISLICLKRVGIKQTPDLGLLYDTRKEVFYVYIPKKKLPK